ncbi:protocadherin-10 [Alligator mississippiensis]|uniref:Protocadherin-10 n=1 Tax=Alligator mississippiensis TaxID=8496 RepID=A0A151PEE7_ALLMI|nr:protocadherin-10 [Alligator mississippiensis]
MEEQEHGTFVGNIAEDLGLDVTKLSARRFQAAPNSRSPYLALDLETGVLSVFLENPLELFRVEVEVLDINDNPPAFPEPDLTVEISESATPGTRLPLESAFDPDTQPGDGSRFAELARTGTALLSAVYAVALAENSPPGTLVLQLNASDPDEGANGEVAGELDYEESSAYQVYVQAKDLGPNAVPAHCKVLVRLLDANDNAPEISFSTVKEASSFKNYYTIVTEGALDREQPGGDAYTLTVVARDGGRPPLSATHSIQSRYRVQIQGMSVFTYVSINAENGFLYALRSFDYEQLKEFSFQNDNAPAVVSPLPGRNGTPARELLPRGAEPGYLVCLTPESAKTDLMFLKPCSPARSADAEHSPCGAIVTAYADQQPDIISNGSILSSETKHQRAELSYLVDRPRRVNSSAFQEADIVSSKDSGHGDSEQGDSDHDATNRGQSSGMDLFSNCTEECKALGHSDRCWMPSFVPSDGRQAADYRSNLHVPGMDSVPDTEVFETPEAQPGAERSFSTFGKEKALHNTLERKELDGLLSNTRAPYKPPYLTRKRIC